MSLWKIAWRSIQQRALASLLTALSMALGVSLVVAVLVVHGVVDRSFRKGAEGYNLIVGAKGGKLQLVLNTVYHLSTPVENIPYGYYKEFTHGKFAAAVEKAVPLCLGDNYEGYRVVGTVPELFEKPAAGPGAPPEPEEYAGGERYEFAAGRNFEQQAFFEAVIGSLAARNTGLEVGDQFQPTHGVSDDGQGHKHDAFTVVGVLKPTGTPNDRALFVNMEGFYLLRGHAKEIEPGEEKEEPGRAGRHSQNDDPAHQGASHRESHDEEPPTPSAQARRAHPFDAHSGDDEPGKHEEGAQQQGGEHGAQEHEGEEHDGDGHEGHEQEAHGHEAEEQERAGHAHGRHDHEIRPLPEAQREVTAILVRTNRANMLAGMELPRQINKDSVAQAVQPAREIFSLFEGIVGNVQMILLFLAVLIVVVAGIGIMVSIYNSMSDRRREIAIMRSLGARRTTVLNVVLLESILLSLGGGLAGCLLGHGLIGALSPWIVAQTGVTIGFLQFDRYELFLIQGLVVLASLVGFLPAVTAYRTDVAKALSAAP